MTDAGNDIRTTIDGAGKCLYLAIWEFPSRRPRYFITDNSCVISHDKCNIKVKYKVIYVVLFKQA